MSQTTGNTAALVVQQIYSSALIESFDEQLTDSGLLFNDRTSEFPEGDRLNINQIGDVTLSPFSENQPLTFSAIDTSRIYLQLTDRDSDGWFITDELKEDAASQIPGLVAARTRKSAQAFRQKMVSDIFAVSNQQTLSNPNLINGQPHRFVANGGSNGARKITLDDIRKMKLSFDQANIPANGRVFFVDPTVEFDLNGLSQVVTSENPNFQGLIETGFADRNSMQFYRNIYGFDIMITTLLPVVGVETITGGFTDTAKTTGVNGVANIAMYVGDDDGKPFMGVIRRAPTAGMKRNDDLGRDEYFAKSRWGYALQRPESIVVVLTDK
jgi:hypothetical protein